MAWICLSIDSGNIADISRLAMKVAPRPVHVVFEGKYIWMETPDTVSGEAIARALENKAAPYACVTLYTINIPPPYYQRVL